jgi:D-serine deaminase-like pyridoxal phosphate-dependent protein
MSAWHLVENVADVPSPALLIYPERVGANVRGMIRIAGRADRLRPHLKTHKLPELVRLQLELGIGKFKCATIAEAEMGASAGVRDVLIAYQMVGPNQARLLELCRKYPATTFSCITDHADNVKALAGLFSNAGRTLDVLLDLDCGQHRTGIEPGAQAVELYRRLAASPGLRPGGLHAYDGHITESDPARRAALFEAALAPVEAFREELLHAGLPVPRVVAGGLPTFPIHARNQGVECSPGTCVLWDFGYSDKYPELDFLHAALVLTRVVSKPCRNRLCLDLGHKAIAAENPHPRVRLLELPEATFVAHSEEHLVIESDRAGQFAVGDCLYGIPRHVCPTVALYSEATVIRNGRASEAWRVAARERRLTI